MEGDGCHDQAQSEQFIATIALHALTFASTPGFASPGNSGSGAQTHFRMLLPVYRDLWDKLEAKRKDTEDATNHSIWRQLKGIAELRIGAALKVMQ
jgi:ATP-dependent RNA helicase DHX29